MLVLVVSLLLFYPTPHKEVKAIETTKKPLTRAVF